MIPQLRALFRALNLEVAAYTDDDLLDAVLAVCPVVDDQWPSDEQVRLVFRRLKDH